MITKKFLNSCIVILLTFASSSYAEFETADDAVGRFEYLNRHITVNSDATAEDINEFKYVILKDPARSRFAKFTLNYQSELEDIKILEAKTIVNGKEFSVSADMINDSEISSNSPGYDKTRVIAISFPKPIIGATICLKYKKTLKKPIIENLFATNGHFGFGGYWVHGVVHINSAIPLYLKINDPFNKLKVETDEKKNQSNTYKNIKISLIEPIITGVINEPNYGKLSDEKGTFFLLSSIKDWKPISLKLHNNFQQVQNQKLPKFFNDVVQAAKQAKTDKDKINVVTRKLNDRIEYFSDTRTVKGSYRPQDLQIIADRQSGDCKDFATLTAKILSSVGFKTQLAVVNRDIYNKSVANKLPSLSEFNHVIVYAVSEKGTAYWIDPTNYYSYAGEIFLDIADKDALMLGPEGKIMKTAPSNPEASVCSSKTRIDKNFKLSNTTFLKGYNTTHFRNIAFGFSEKSAKMKIAKTLAIEHTKEENILNIELPKELKNKILTPLNFKVQYYNDQIFTFTNHGYAYKPGNILTLSKISQIDPKKNISDLFLAFPATYRDEVILENKSARNLDSLNLIIVNKYLNFKRNCFMQNNNIHVVDELKIKKPWIPSSEYKTAEFKKLQQLCKKITMNPLIITD